MGAEIVTEHGYIEARVPAGQRLRGATVEFEKISVTGTENILMAAALADGKTTIRNAAREPEIGDLADLLRKMGARISGDGTEAIRVEGVSELHGADHTIIPDRIEAGTFLVAGAITGGNLQITECEPKHLESLLAKLSDAGAKVVRNGPQCLQVSVPGKL